METNHKWTVAVFILCIIPFVVIFFIQASKIKELNRTIEDLDASKYINVTVMYEMDIQIEKLEKTLEFMRGETAGLTNSIQRLSSVYKECIDKTQP